MPSTSPTKKLSISTTLPSTLIAATETELSTRVQHSKLATAFPILHTQTPPLPPPQQPPPPPKRLTARQKVRARLAASSGPALPKTFRPSAVIADTGFLNTKRDKRLIKSSSFASRIVKTSTTTKKKRSRPSKTLVASLDSLGDALDSITADLAASGNAPMDREQAAQGRVRHRSLKSRPGALKRKEKVVRAEMERFGRSLASMSGTGEEKEGTAEQVGGQAGGEAMETETQQQQAAPAASRWAALRGQISKTMEQNPAFLNKT